MFKRLISFISILTVLTAVLGVSASAVVDKSEKYYVADYAGVLSESTEDEIVLLNDYLEHCCDGAQIVIVSVEYLDGMYSDEYAVQLFNDWGVGNKNANNGMLMLLATEENKGWLTTGAGISNSFTDDMADSYLDEYFWGDFDDGKYDDAVTSLIRALAAWYDSYYGSTILSDMYGMDGSQYVDNRFSTASIIYNVAIRLIVLCVFLAFFFVCRANDRRRYNAYYTHIGAPIPPYHFWYMWSMMPHRRWIDPNDHRPPRGPRGPGGFGGGSGGFGGGFGGGSGFGGGGFSGGGGGGRR